MARCLKRNADEIGYHQGQLILNVRLLIVCLIIGACTGCVTTDEDAAKAVAALRNKNAGEAIAWSEMLATESSYTKRLGEVEAGRANMLTGRIDESCRWFRQAVDSAIDRQEAQPKIKLSDVGNTALAATMTDDRMREYVLAPYEINLALEYLILSQEALGRREDALVDARLAVYVQDNLSTTYGADIAKAESSASASAKSVCSRAEQSMVEMMTQTRNSWENPVLWWLTGVLFEANGEMEQAFQSYRKAAAIRPDNTVFAADAARADAQQGFSKDKSRLVFIFGEGFVAGRESLKVPVPLYTSMSIDIPIYRNPQYVPQTVTITEKGKMAQTASPALNVQSLACRDLKEQLPGIVTRNITRAVTAVGAQVAVNNAGNEYAQVAVLVANVIATSIRRADTRSWRTLPLGEQVWSDATLSPGTHDFDVCFGGVACSVSVDLKLGETKIIYINGMEC